MGGLLAQTRDDGLDSTRAEQELQDFAYLVAHDLANEFRHVAEFSRLLGDELGEGAPSAYAQAIVDSADRCQAMLRGILAYSALQSQKLMRRRWPGRSVVERAVVELGANGSSRAANIHIDVEGEVDADARLLISAVRMALANALQFARDGRELVINVTGAAADGCWRLEIADNGEGLERGYHEKAFGMFWRLNPDPPRVGAGLTMIRRIARRHGGDARFLDSADGARFEIVIPTREAQ
jgi:light-regulated signal transduction histidine kinase (bacteriophytochrome)